MIDVGGIYRTRAVDPGIPSALVLVTDVDDTTRSVAVTLLSPDIELGSSVDLLVAGDDIGRAYDVLVQSDISSAPFRRASSIDEWQPWARMSWTLCPRCARTARSTTPSLALRSSLARTLAGTSRSRSYGGFTCSQRRASDDSAHVRSRRPRDTSTYPHYPRNTLTNARSPQHILSASALVRLVAVGGSVHSDDHLHQRRPRRSCPGGFRGGSGGDDRFRGVHRGRRCGC